MTEKILNKKLAFIDIETTGLDYDKHEIIEVGCIIAICERVENKYILTKLDEFEFKTKPNNISNADEIALKINKFKLSDWNNAEDLEHVIKILSEKTIGAVMVAHNIIFDYSFLDRAFKKFNIKNEMNYYGLDTISMAYTKLVNTEDVDKVSLHNLTKYFGIKNENEHSALSDCQATLELFEKLINL